MSSIQPTRLATSFKAGTLILEYKDLLNKKKKPRQRNIHLSEYLDANKHLTDHELIVAIKRDVIYERHKKYFEKVRSSHLEDVLTKLIHSLRPHESTVLKDETKEEEIAEEFGNDFEENHDQYNFENDDTGFENNHDDGFENNADDNFDEFDEDFDKNFNGNEDNFIEEEHFDAEEADETNTEDAEAIYDEFSTTDLNKVSQEKLEEAKSKMEKVYLKNQKKPGEEGYEYDVQVDFKPTQASDWDD